MYLLRRRAGRRGYGGTNETDEDGRVVGGGGSGSVV